MTLKQHSKVLRIADKDKYEELKNLISKFFQRDQENANQPQPITNAG